MSKKKKVRKVSPSRRRKKKHDDVHEEKAKRGIASVERAKHKVKGKKTLRKTKTKRTKKRKVRAYQRGALGSAIYNYFDRVGVDKAKFEQALKIAKKAKPDTTYGKAYFSWHKNHYKNDQYNKKCK